MRAIRELPPKAAKAIRLVLTDIDDTLTAHGKLEPEAFLALGELRRAGLYVVPVTGRPAGWCDAIARQWPVDAVIGENGAFVFYEQQGVLKARFHPEAYTGSGEFPSHAAIEAIRARLSPVRDRVLKAIPGSRVSKDQPYRIFDLAIDFREEAPDLGFDAAERIRAECEAAGCVAKVSSIHVNAWFGAYDKLAMARQVSRELFAIDDPNAVLFVGDSPNDAPMFAGFANGVGVANVRQFEGRMPTLPAYVSDAPGGLGFAEIARVLLAARSVC